jgi:hypothetical protein
MGSRYGSDTSSGGYQDRAASGDGRDRAQQTVLGALAEVVADDHDLGSEGGTATLREEHGDTDASSRASGTVTAVLSRLVDDPESMSTEEHHAAIDLLSATAASGESLGSGIDGEIHSWLDVLVEQKDEISDRAREEATSLVDLFF